MSGRQGQQSEIPRGLNDGQGRAGNRVRARDTADEHFNTPPGAPPSYGWASSEDASDRALAISFPSPPPGTNPMVFCPRGTFDRLAPSRPSSDLGYSPVEGLSGRGRQFTRTPDSASQTQRTSASGSDITTLGQDDQYDDHTLRDMEIELARRRETMIRTVAPERRAALVESVAPGRTGNSGTSGSDVNQVFSRRSSPSEEGSQIPRQPRTARNLQSESDRRQSRFLDSYASEAHRGR